MATLQGPSGNNAVAYDSALISRGKRIMRNGDIVNQTRQIQRHQALLNAAHLRLQDFDPASAILVADHINAMRQNTGSDSTAFLLPAMTVYGAADHPITSDGRITGIRQTPRRLTGNVSTSASESTEPTLSEQIDQLRGRLIAEINEHTLFLQTHAQDLTLEIRRFLHDYFRTDVFGRYNDANEHLQTSMLDRGVQAVIGRMAHLLGNGLIGGGEVPRFNPVAATSSRIRRGIRYILRQVDRFLGHNGHHNAWRFNSDVVKGAGWTAGTIAGLGLFGSGLAETIGLPIHIWKAAMANNIPLVGQLLSPVAPIIAGVAGAWICLEVGYRAIKHWKTYVEWRNREIIAPLVNAAERVLKLVPIDPRDRIKTFEVPADPAEVALQQRIEQQRIEQQRLAQQRQAQQSREHGRLQQ